MRLPNEITTPFPFFIRTGQAKQMKCRRQSRDSGRRTARSELRSKCDSIFEHYAVQMVPSVCALQATHYTVIASQTHKHRQYDNINDSISLAHRHANTCKYYCSRVYALAHRRQQTLLSMICFYFFSVLLCGWAASDRSITIRGSQI